jgi:hypothetical protein
LVHGNAAERQACGSFKLSNIHLILQVEGRTGVHIQGGFHDGSRVARTDEYSM